MQTAIIIVLIIIIVIDKALDNKKVNTENEQIEKTVNNYKEKYKKSDYLLTPTELKFYKLLKTITDKMEYSLFVQIPLYQLVEYKDFKDFNKIKSKSIDFVITEKNCKVKLCIELDDKTHNNNKRIERDKFINEMFRELDIKILRIPVQNYYNMQEIEQKIKESL